MLENTKLDLDNERQTRRQLQQKEMERAELHDVQAKQPFVAAVIDADNDGYMVRRFAASCGTFYLIRIGSSFLKVTSQADALGGLRQLTPSELPYSNICASF